MKLTKTQRKVLQRAEEVVWDPPYGVWRLDGVRLDRRTCEPLERAGLIIRGTPLGSSIYYCKLTPAGLSALSSKER